MSFQERRIEIFDVCSGDKPSDVFLLVHVEEEPGEEGTYHAAVVKLSATELTVEYRLPTWSSSFWRSPSGVIYVAGMDGKVFWGAGKTWNSSVLSDQHTLNVVWGLSAEDIYCSGPGAQLYRKSGLHWNMYNTGLEGDLYAIGGTTHDNLYVLGEMGVLFHTNGKQWNQLESPTNTNLVDVHCVSANEAYFCGWHGKFFRLKEDCWEDFSLGNRDTNLYRIAEFRRQIFVGSDEEGLLRFDGRQLVPFGPDIKSIGIRTIGERLCAFGDTTIQWFDGNAWQRLNLDLTGLFSSSSHDASAE
jgi:hypothetical protein